MDGEGGEGREAAETVEGDGGREIGAGGSGAGMEARGMVGQGVGEVEDWGGGRWRRRKREAELSGDVLWKVYQSSWASG